MDKFSPDSIKLLRWNKETGIGYFPVDEVTPVHPYNEDYFNKYAGYAQTDLGKRLTQFRVEFVKKFWHGEVLDVGIGSGQFIEAHRNAIGMDVNESAIAWLELNSLNYSGGDVNAATFWDSLEHIKSPKELLSRVKRFVFVTIPVFDSYEQILASRHFRPDEHYWYFSPYGFSSFMWDNGFRVISQSDEEQRLGRESVMSFALERRNKR